MTPDLVLASSSPTRRLILTEAGIRFRVIASDVEEVIFPAPTDNLVAALAQQKAAAVASQLDSALVLGCDSLLDLDGVAYGKPSSKAEAKERWRLQRGRDGVLYTGHVLIDAQGGTTSAEVVSTVVRFGSPSDQEIDSYVESGEPLDKAGSFTLEGRSSAFLRGIDGDAGNVRGLSVAALARLLARQSWSIVDFWSEAAT